MALIFRIIMKKISKYWIKTFILSALLLSNTIAKAQVDNFILSVQNLTQTASNVLEFDVYLLDGDPGQVFELAGCQLGFLFNSNIYSGGSVTVTNDNTGTGLNIFQQFPAPSVLSTVTGYPDQTLIRQAAGYAVLPGAGTIISTVNPGTLLTHYVISSTVSFTSNSTPNIIFTSSSVTSPLYATRVAEFIGISTQLTVTPGVNAIVNGNPILNPPPSIFDVTGGGSYCQGTSGLPVGLDDSESGVTYTLYRNISETVTTATGTGGALSFGNQTEGSYTVSGTNGSGTAPMNGSAVIVENPNATIALSSGSSTQTVCISTPITNIEYTIGGGGTGAEVTGLPSGVSGLYSGGTFTISGSPSQSGTYNYTVTTTGTCTQATATGILTVRSLQIAAAGADQVGSSMCGLTSTTLAGNTPTEGTGAWSIVSGTGGSISTPSSPTSTFSGTAGSTYTLRWTISNSPCTASTDDVTITFQRNPTTAAAGADQDGASMCGLTSTTLAGNTPTIGTGAWSIVSGSGGSITTPSSPTSTFSGTAGTTYTLRWTISNSPCTASTDDVTITFQRNPTTAAAGADQVGSSMCGLTSTTLAGNTPTVGTGAWSIVSGAGGSITTPSSPTSAFSGTAGTTYVLRWTISNSPCTASTDDVTITFQRNPTTAAAGADQVGSSMCGLTSTTLAGNTPTDRHRGMEHRIGSRRQYHHTIKSDKRIQRNSRNDICT